MKKIILIFSLFILGHQIQIFAQDFETMQKELNTVSENSIYLKDFKYELNSGENYKFSLILKKETIYHFFIYNTVKIPAGFTIFFDDKEVFPIAITVKQKNIIDLAYQFKETGIYTVFVNNKTDHVLKSMILLTCDENNDITKLLASADVKEVSNQKVEAPETEDKWVEIEAPVAIEKSPKTTEFEKNDLFLIVEQMPRFKGSNSKENSDEAFKKFIIENTTYPQEAKDKKITGRVYVSFVVSSDGYIKNAKVSRSVHPSLDQEALRIIYASPKWEPGIKDGKPVNVSYTIPIDFKLD